MKVALRAVMTAALLAAAAAARADDLCYGSAFLPEGNPIYEFQLTAHKSKTPQAFAARLSISARAPGIVYSTRGAALALQSKVGETDIDIFFDVATGGLIPTRLKAGVYYPTTIANPPRVVIQGPFGQIEGQAARPDPNLNDVYADFTLSRDQLRAFTPGARLDLAVNDAGDATLLESGTFDIADLATLRALAKSAAENLDLHCTPMPDDGLPF